MLAALGSVRPFGGDVDAFAVGMQLAASAATTATTAVLTAAFSSVSSSSVAVSLSATAVTSTYAQAVSLGSTAATTRAAASSSSAAISSGPLPSAAPGLPTIVSIDGAVEVSGGWTAAPNQVTVFSGSASTTTARLTVRGTATIAGDAIVQLPDATLDDHRIRLVLGIHVTGNFRTVEVKGPPGDCNRYIAKPLALPTLYAIDVGATAANCPTHPDVPLIVVGVTISGVFGVAIIVSAVIHLLSKMRPDILPTWIRRRRIASDAYFDLNEM